MSVRTTDTILDRILVRKREEIDALIDALGEAAKVFGHGAVGQ